MAVLEWALVLLILFGGIAVSVGAIVGSLDAAEYPAEAWERAGYRRNRWVWQVFGVLCVPVALVYTGSYLARVRPRLMRAARDLAVERYVPGRGLAAAPDRFSQPVRLRTSWLAVALNGGPGVVMFGAFGVFALANGDTRLGPLMLVPGVAFTAGLAASNRLYGVTLGPGGIQMNGLRRRHIAWPDVVAITERRTAGTRCPRVWTRTGPSRTLRAPVMNFGLGRKQYDAEFALLQQWWRACAPGPGGEPPPA